MSDFIDELTNAQLDRLQARLTLRLEQRKAEREEADRERRNPRPLRPHIGDAGQQFGNDLARRNWDSECLGALQRQTVPFAVAPRCSVLCGDGRTRLSAGQELLLANLDALKGDRLQQIAKLVRDGHVLATEEPWNA